MADEVGNEFFYDYEGEEVEEPHTSSFNTTSAPASASPTTTSSAPPTASTSSAPATRMAIPKTGGGRGGGKVINYIKNNYTYHF